jgi:sensor histidine kinase regulating citrate/malate metabolism
LNQIGVVLAGKTLPGFGEILLQLKHEILFIVLLALGFGLAGSFLLPVFDGIKSADGGADFSLCFGKINVLGERRGFVPAAFAEHIYFSEAKGEIGTAVRAFYPIKDRDLNQIHPLNAFRSLC